MEYFRNIEYDYATPDDTFIIRGLQANEIVDAITDLESGSGSQTYEINTVATMNYILVLTDAHKLILFTRDGGVQITVPTNALVAFPIGTRIRIAKTGTTGNANAYGTPTINSPFVAPAVEHEGTGELIKIDTDEWMFTGDLLNDA